MLTNASIVAHSEFGGVHKGDASTRVEQRVQIHTQRHKRGGKELHEAHIANQTGKLAVQMLRHVLGVERGEGAIV